MNPIHTPGGEFIPCAYREKSSADGVGNFYGILAHSLRMWGKAKKMTLTFREDHFSPCACGEKGEVERTVTDGELQPVRMWGKGNDSLLLSNERSSARAHVGGETDMDALDAGFDFSPCACGGESDFDFPQKF